MNWFRNFMAGRYGVDQLSIGLFIFYLVIWFIERMGGWWWMAFLTGAIILLIFFRTFSRNIPKRQAENQKFLSMLASVKGFFQRTPKDPQKQYEREHKKQEERAQRQAAEREYARQREAEAKRRAELAAERKTHRRFRCPQCGQEVRVPKGKGKIKIRCPKCGNEFIEKT